METCWDQPTHHRNPRHAYLPPYTTMPITDQASISPVGMWGCGEPTWLWKSSLSARLLVHGHRYLVTGCFMQCWV